MYDIISFQYFKYYLHFRAASSSFLIAEDEAQDEGPVSENKSTKCHVIPCFWISHFCTTIT